MWYALVSSDGYGVFVAYLGYLGMIGETATNEGITRATSAMAVQFQEEDTVVDGVKGPGWLSQYCVS